MNDAEKLESVFLASGPDDTPQLAHLLDSPPPEQESGEAFGDAPATSDLIPLEVWQEQWGAVHDMIGGMVQMRSGAPCPLGDQARNSGGIMAANACYSLLVSTPFLAKIFLSAQSSFAGQIMIVGMHGFGCIQMVKASRAAAPQADAMQ